MSSVQEGSAESNQQARCIAKWLGYYVADGQTVELRAIKKAGGADSRIFQSVDELAACAASEDAADDYKGIYFTLNPLDPDLASRRNGSARAEHVIQRRWLPFDFDAIRATATNATDQEKAEAWEALATIKLNLERVCGLQGAVVCDSGNGWHLCYPLDLPNSDSAYALIKNTLAGVSEFLPEELRGKVEIDPKVCDAPRIWKLPGTVARKGPHTDERPQREALLIEEMSTVWTAENATVNNGKLAGIVERCQRIRDRISGRGHEGQGDAEAWAQAALRDEAEAVANASAQSWNDQLNISAHNLGQLVPRYLDEQTVVAALTEASARRGHQEDEAARAETARTIRSGLEKGKTRPREYRGASRASRSTNAQPVERPAIRAPDWKPFPVDVLPDKLAAYVHAASSAIGCDPSFVALPLLAGLGAAIGNSRVIQLKRGWTEPAVLWTVTISESGNLKTPPLYAALAPIFKKQNDAIRRHKSAKEDYKRLKAMHDAAMRRWQKTGANAGQPLPDAPVEPVCERFIVDDITAEALAGKLEHAPRGLLLCKEELAGWLGGFGQYKRSSAAAIADSVHFLKMHGARPVLIDRKTGNTTIHVPRAFLPATGSIQPGIMRAVAVREHFESGLVARLLPAMPPREEKKWTEAIVDPELQREIADIYERLYSLSMPLDADGVPEPVALELSPRARIEWVSFYNDFAKEQIQVTGDLAAAFSKLEGGAARLALILSLANAAENDVAGDPTITIDGASVEVGIILARWFQAEVERVYAVLGENAGQQQQRELVETIRRKGGSVTPRELMQAARKYRESVEVAEAALQALVEAGLATREPPETKPEGGNPGGSRYRLTPGNSCS
jgi:hypothetical protein